MSLMTERAPQLEHTSSNAVESTIPRDSLATWSLRAARTLVLATSLFFIGCYLACAALRLAYPWELEWMEGGMIMHAARVLRGLSIYARPSLDFIAYFYTPLYAYVLAALSYVCGGLSYALARAVSLTASLSIMAMLFYAGRRERGTTAGLLAVGLYAALFRISGTFYDLARADSLSLAFGLGACLLAYYVPTSRAAAGAALLVVCAFFAKQTSGLVGPFIGLYLLLSSWRRGLLYGAVGIAAGLAIGYALERASGGWFLFYIVKGHQGHAFFARHFVLEYWRDLLFLCPLLLLAPVLGASYGRVSRWFVAPVLLLCVVAFLDRAQALDFTDDAFYRELWYQQPRAWLLLPPFAITLLLLAARCLRPEIQTPPTYYLLLMLSGVLASDLNYSTQWAFSNCFIPIAVYGSLYAAMLLGPLLDAAFRGVDATPTSALAVAAALLVQLGALVYDPRAQVPSAGDRTAAREIQRILSHCPGPVLMLGHPFYSYQRDGTLHTHAMGFLDVGYAGGVRDLAAQIASGKYRTIVTEDRQVRLPRLEQFYVKVHTLRYDGAALLPHTGYQVRPAAIYVYRASQAANDCALGSGS